MAIRLLFADFGDGGWCCVGLGARGSCEWNGAEAELAGASATADRRTEQTAGGGSVPGAEYNRFDDWFGFGAGFGSGRDLR